MIERFAKSSSFVGQHKQSPKYYINCMEKLSKSNYSTENWLQLTRTLQTSNRNKILHGIFENHREAVAKIGDSGSIENEYVTSQILYNNQVKGFINFFCYFSCNYSNVSHETPLCKGPCDNLKVIVMPYYVLGSFAQYDWNANHFNALTSCIKQVLASLYTAYNKVGFIHNDIHTNNVLLKTTSKPMKIFDDIVIPCYGLQTVIMDFENAFMPHHSFTPTTDSDIIFYQSIQRFLLGIQTEVNINFTNVTQITNCCEYIVEQPIASSMSTLINLVDTLHFKNVKLPMTVLPKYDPNTFG